MIKPIFINNDDEKEESLDYQFLRNKAIEYAQELGGAIWTDYNEHDPGVTILEQLCYALTDLAYRAGFNIEDILQTGVNNRKNFMHPREIFPCNALTINDYRKIIFDSLFEIQNVWVKPVRSSEHSLNGLYKILIDLDASIDEDTQKQEVIEQVKEVFTEHRSLGEDINQVTILDNLLVTVNADIEIDGSRPLESILAEIFFQVDEYLSPEIKFYSLEELKQQGKSLSEIFEGPLLKHGFIKEDELFDKSKKVLVSEITKIVMDIPGIISVKNIFLEVDGEKHFNQINIEEHQLPKLNPVVQKESGAHFINFFKGGVRYGNINPKAVTSELNVLQYAYRRVYRLNEEEIQTPRGNEFKLDQYHSIQNHFPQVYGITEFGIPERADEQRRAQVKQLRGYLMLFEQVIANYLSQLSNVKELLTLTPRLDRTYFHQLLTTVTDAEEIFQDKPDEMVEITGVEEENIPNSYQEGLERIMELSDNRVNRSNRLMDFILAAHGESFNSYALSQFNFYYSKEEFDNKLIHNKINFIKCLPDFNKNRAKAYNYLRHSLGTSNMSGLERKLSIILGLEEKENTDKLSYIEHSTTKHFEQFDLRLIEERPSKSNGTLWFSKSELSEKDYTSDQIKENFDFIDDEEFELGHFAPEDQELMLSLLPFQSRVLPIPFMSEALNLSRYRIGKYSEKAKKYHILFREGDLNNHEKENWIELGEYANESDAKEAIGQLIATLRGMHIRSEGLQLVEHILLRPEVWEQKFGIYLMNEKGVPVLRTSELYTFEERKLKVEEIKEHLSTYENYSIEITESRDFEIYFKSPDGSIEMVSLEPMESVEKIHEIMEELFDFLSDKSDINPYEEKIGLYIQSSEKGSHIPEHFFTFRTTLIFPNWTARFSNLEFRRIAEETALDYAPANISLNIKWVNFDDMSSFEELYYKWMELLQKDPRSNAKLRDTSAKLSELLLSFNKKYD